MTRSSATPKQANTEPSELAYKIFDAIDDQLRPSEAPAPTAEVRAKVARCIDGQLADLLTERDGLLMSLNDVCCSANRLLRVSTITLKVNLLNDVKKATELVAGHTEAARITAADVAETMPPKPEESR